MSEASTGLAESFLALLNQDPPPDKELGPSIGQKENVQKLVTDIISDVKAQRPDLWDGTCLSTRRYPSQSEADFALCGLIGRVALRLNAPKDDLAVIIGRVFRQSKLYRETKQRTVTSQTIPKILSSLLEPSRPPTTSPEREPPPPSKLCAEALLSDLVLSDSHVQEMQDAVFIVRDMIVRGHMVAFVAPANSGKTALLVHFSEQISSAGYHLLYINCDASPSDLKRHYQHAKKHHYKLIAPDAIPGKSPRDVLVQFKQYLESGVDLSNVVIVLDTLKKFVDVIEKRAAKELYSLLRGLTVRGCTVVLLGHCNKHLDKEHRTIYEGTADLRNDLDEMIYLDAQKNPTGSALSITTRPDKVRADIKPRSFLIHLPDRRVEELDRPVQILTKGEEEVLNLAAQGIWLEKTSQKDLIEFILEHSTSGIGEKKVKGIIARHAMAENRITVRKLGRAKDLAYGLTEEEAAFQKKESEFLDKLPF